MFKNKKYLYVLILVLLIFFVRQFAFYDNDIHTQEEGYRLYLYSSINKGALLYRDIGYHLGIISPYFYGFIFKILGEELLYIRAAAIVICALGIFGMFLIASELLPPLWAGLSSFLAFSLFFMWFYEYGYVITVSISYFAIYFSYLFIKDRKIKYFILSVFLASLTCLHNLYIEGFATVTSIGIAMILYWVIKRELSKNFKYIIIFFSSVFILYLMFYSYFIIKLPFDVFIKSVIPFLGGRYESPLQVRGFQNLFAIFINNFPSNITFENLYLFIKKIYYGILFYFPIIFSVSGFIYYILRREFLGIRGYLILVISICSFLIANRMMVYGPTGHSDVFWLAPSIFLSVFFLYKGSLWLKENILKKRWNKYIFRAVIALFIISFYSIGQVPNLNPGFREAVLETPGVKGIHVFKNDKEFIEGLVEFINEHSSVDDKILMAGMGNLFEFLTKRKSLFADNILIFMPIYNSNLLVDEEYIEGIKQEILKRVKNEKPKIILFYESNWITIDETFPELKEYIIKNYKISNLFGTFIADEFEKDRHFRLYQGMRAFVYTGLQ